MNWERIEGKWSQFKGQVKSTWGKLTDDEITSLKGKRDRLSGIIQTRYGVMKEDAEKQIDAWLTKLDESLSNDSKDAHH